MVDMALIGPRFVLGSCSQSNVGAIARLHLGAPESGLEKTGRLGSHDLIDFGSDLRMIDVAVFAKLCASSFR